MKQLLMKSRAEAFSWKLNPSTKILSLFPPTLPINSSSLVLPLPTVISFKE
jgi:hypothetical protein